MNRKEIVQTLGGQIELRNLQDSNGQITGLQALVLLPPASDTHAAQTAPLG